MSMVMESLISSTFSCLMFCKTKFVRMRVIARPVLCIIWSRPINAAFPEVEASSVRFLSRETES